MPDLKISELPAASSVADADLTPFVQTAPTPATRRATLSQLRRAVLADRGVDVRDFGALGNGTANDAPAIQAAINALGTAGGVVQFGPRTYRIASAITISSTSVRLQGAGFAEGGQPGEGTWLTVDQTGFTPFTFSGVAARGSVVRDMAFRQSHTAPQDAAWAPTNYDFLFRVTDCLGGVDFDNVMLSGINRGILVRNSGRTDFRRIRGQVFTTGIEIDEGYDTSRILNLHLWPFFSANNNVVRWQQANGDALVFRRCDGVFVDQAFVLGYRSMFRFTSSAAGYTQKFSIGQAYADFVRHGVWVEAAGTDGQIDAMTVQCEIFNAGGAPLPGSFGIYVNTNSSRVQVGSLRIDDAEDNPIRIEGHSNRLDIGALRCVNFNLRNNGAAAIHLANAATGVPNRVNLASPPLLETANLGPVFNAGSNGSVGVQAPAGEAARPGLSLGQNDTGLFRPAAGVLAAATAGVERLRLTSGTATIGAASGAHGLEVTTPASAVNRPEILGAVTGTPSRVGWRAMGSDANISAVMQPKGTGALIAQFPDNATAGGNARGANAVDWQASRSSAFQVAAGNFSTIGGGQNNTANGLNATVGGGLSNGAFFLYATVAGGNSNTANGQVSWCPGGQNGSARGLFAPGFWAAGQFSAAGDAQAEEHVLRRQTTDATATRLTANNAVPGTTNTVNLSNNSLLLVTLLLVARQAGGAAGAVNDSAVWEIKVGIKRGASAAATALVGGASITRIAFDAAAAAWAADVAADTANGGLALTVTGEADKNINWVARGVAVQVG